MNRSATIEMKNREIFSIILNYKYTEMSNRSQKAFLKAHLAEHLILENAYYYFYNHAKNEIELMKYISGLTNIDYSSFLLTASNNFTDLIDMFFYAITNFNDNKFISEESFFEQKEAVYREYGYKRFSYKGCCNIFLNFIYELLDIDIENELNMLSLKDIINFIDVNFVLDNLSVTYVGKCINKMNGFRYMEESNKSKFTKKLYPIKRKKNFKEFYNTNLGETWFGKIFSCVHTISQYFEFEILSKTIYFSVKYLLKSEDTYLPVDFIGTHYTKYGSYFVCKVNEIIDPEKVFEIRKLDLDSIIENVLTEYKNRLIIKLDGLIEFARFSNKMLLLTNSFMQDIEQYIFILDSISIENIKELIYSINKFEYVHFFS